MEKARIPKVKPINQWILPLVHPPVPPTLLIFHIIIKHKTIIGERVGSQTTFEIRGFFSFAKIFSLIDINQWRGCK
jgi:hypothetical protein